MTPSLLPVTVTESEREKIVQFLLDFGSLVFDWKSWLFDTHRIFYDSDLTIDSRLGKPCNAIEEYLRYTHILFNTTFIPSIATPVWLYIWAANLFAAHDEHPEWPGCQAFFSERLASLRLTSKYLRAPISLSLQGELIDYLAITAVMKQSVYEFEPRTCRNPDCAKQFFVSDGRQHYCDECRGDRVISSVKQKRYRERKKTVTPSNLSYGESAGN